MFEPQEYELLDFGGGRKLERFGAEVLDRPSPAADGAAVLDPGSWGSASLRFDLGSGGRGDWSGDRQSWAVRHGGSQLLMQLSASGNLGVFPEQAPNWDWIGDQVKQSATVLSRRPRVLNLFAYTGAASLAAAAVGAEVTHIDASGPSVAWARRNAEVSGLADLPIRWIVEDAMKFVARECKRGNSYDGVIADPPTYGHGPKGRPFKFKQHVGDLMAMCGELVGASDSAGPGVGRFLLFSAHTPGFDVADAVSTVDSVLPESDGARVTGRALKLRSADGRELAAGVSARWTSNQ